MIFNRLALYCFVALSLVFLIPSTNAETIPATATPSGPIGYHYQGNIPYRCEASQDASCSYTCGAVGSSFNGTASDGRCFCLGGNWNGQWAYGYDRCEYTIYSCPSDGGWTLSGSTCTRSDCSPPQVRDSNGQCVADQKKCAEIVVTPTGSCVQPSACSWTDQLTFADGLKAQPICANAKSDKTNCGASGGIVIGYFGDKPMCLSPPPTDATCDALGGKVVGTLNGQPVCSQANNPTCPGGGASQGTVNGQPVCNGNCPAGTAQGTVNGATSCYPVSPTTDKKTTTKSSGQGSTTETTSTDPNTPSTTSRRTSSTTCDGTRCTTTTVEDSGNGTPVKTTTTGEDQNDFCTKNPKSSVCTGQTEADKFCEEHPTSVSCMETGSPTDDGPLSTVDKSTVSSITPVSIATAAGCPADVQLGKGVVVTYAGVCQFAEGLRPIVLASAWLLAGLIVLGMAKGT